MKNFIKYYYGIDIDEYKNIDNNIYFNNYEFIKFNGEINDLMNMYYTLITYNIYCHEIIINKDNSPITIYNGDKYILIKRNISNEDYININNIYNYDVYIRSNRVLNWKQLWGNKIDYYEYQMSELGLKYKTLKESFSYYSGLCECAIGLLNYVNYKNIRINIAHKRINYNETFNNFTNPINITIDNITRDLAEYIKINAIYGNLDIDKTLKELKRIKLTSDEYILFMARLIYPSYYFDMYDNIIQGLSKEEDVDIIIKKSNSFESLLKKLYILVKQNTNLPTIEWLHNSNNF